VVFKGGAVIVLKFGDNDYRYYVFNIDKGTYKILSFSDSDNIFTMGDWGLWIKGDKVFDADGNRWTLINDAGVTNFSTVMSDDYGSGGDSRFGSGTIILRRSHTESYKFVRYIKKRTLKVVIVHNDLGDTGLGISHTGLN